MADPEGSSGPFEMFEGDVALAALRCHRAVYGDTFRSDTVAVVVALNEFWLARFRAGYPPPIGREPEAHEQAPAARQDSPSATGTS